MKMFTKLILTGVLSSFIGLNAVPYKVDASHTEVGFSVRHLMITNVKGQFNDFDGEIDFNKDTKQFNILKGVIKAASVDTDNKKRDDHLRGKDFFLAEEYPDITFNMTSFKPEANGGMMEADLTIRGVTKPVMFEITDLGTIKDFQGNDRVGFTINGEINRKDFGLTWNKVTEFGGVAVGEKVKITVDLQGIAK